MKPSPKLLLWLGGTASTPTLGLDLRPASGSFVNVWSGGNGNSSSSRRATQAQFQPSATSQLHSFAPPERRQLLSHIKVGRPQWSIQKFHRVLRADIYDELLKLPLRFALHDFDTLEQHLMGGRSPRFKRETTAPSHRGKEVEEEEDTDEVFPGVYAMEAEHEAPYDATPLLSDPNSTAKEAHPHSSPSLPSPPPSTSPANDAAQVVDPSTEALPVSSSPFSSSCYSVMGHQPSAVGYAPPLGPADPLDTIPFFVHRTSTGLLPGRVHSMDAKRLMPAFYLRIGNIDGDIFRFEEELLKIFPTKKIFVRRHAVYVYNVNLDGREILFHWLLGLGF